MRHARKHVVGTRQCTKQVLDDRMQRTKDHCFGKKGTKDRQTSTNHKETRGTRDAPVFRHTGPPLALDFLFRSYYIFVTQ